MTCVRRHGTRWAGRGARRTRYGLCSSESAGQEDRRTAWGADACAPTACTRTVSVGVACPMLARVSLGSRQRSKGKCASVRWGGSER
eukprot:192858-Prymnesium_polylepis.1